MPLAPRSRTSIDAERAGAGRKPLWTCRRRRRLPDSLRQPHTQAAAAAALDACLLPRHLSCSMARLARATAAALLATCMLAVARAEPQACPVGEFSQDGGQTVRAGLLMLASHACMGWKEAAMIAHGDMSQSGRCLQQRGIAMPCMCVARSHMRPRTPPLDCAVLQVLR